MNFYEQTFDVNNKTIAELSDDCEKAYINIAGKRANKSMYINLTIEEILIHFKNSFGMNATCTVIGKKSMGGRIFFEILHRDIRKNPIEDADPELTFSNTILQAYSNNPVYSYIERTGTNKVSFEAQLKPIKNLMMYEIFGALFLAILSKFILEFFPETTQQMLNNDIFFPIFSKLTAIISGIATPMVFFAVITGITGVGNSSSVGAMGKTLLKGMSISYLITGAVFSIIAVFFFPVTKIITTSGENVTGQLINLVLDIFPNNLINGFVIDNALQVIALSIFIGITLLLLGDKATKINEIISDLGDILNKMMSLVCKTLPFIVYLGVLSMLLRKTEGLNQLFKMTLVTLLCWAIIIASSIIRLKLLEKVSIIKLFKKQLATFIINITTSSQVAALPENMKCCKEKMGIDEKFTNFGLPLGIVVYMPCGAITIGLTAWVITSMAGTPMDITRIIIIAIVSIIIAIAAPPIPGSYFAVITIIFNSINLSMDYFPVAITIGTVLGYFLPVLNGYLLQLELLIAALKMNKVDKTKLYSEEK